MVSRILAIVVSALSVLFLGFAGVATFGGPNWEAQARAMKEYQYEKAVGPEGQWTVKNAAGDNVGSSRILPGAIVAALDDQNRKLQAQLDELNAREPQLRESQQRLEQQIEADKKALAAAIEQQRQLLAELQQQAAALSAQVVEKTAEASGVHEVIEDRRADVFRLANQLELLRADQARIGQIHRQISDLIEQVNADLDKARRRETQLQERLAR